MTTVVAVPAARTRLPAGVAVFAVAAGWSVVAAIANDGSALTTTALIAGAGGTVAICRIVASRWPSVVPAGLAGMAAALFAVAAIDGTAVAGPLGYANASAALFALACVAGLLLAFERRGPLRVGGAVAALVFVVAVILTSSWTAAVALPVAVAVALAAERRRGGRTAIAVAAGLFLVVLLATVVLGARGPGGGSGAFDRSVIATISEERLALWHDALAITAANPMLGVGPGRFAQTSAIAADPDLRWAHNEFLQSGAETGLPGYALVVGLFLWGFAALSRGTPGRAQALSSAGLAALGIQSSVDYVLHFPVVALAGAAILGAGLGARSGGRWSVFAPTTSSQGSA